MKELFSIFIFVVPFFTLAQNQDKTMKDWVDKWKNNKEYTLSIIEAMPVDNFGFKVTDEVMTFEEQAVHMTNNMTMLSGRFLGFKALEKEVPKGKEPVINYMKKVFDHIIREINEMNPNTLSDKVDFWDGEKSKAGILMLMDNHLSHHRGQAIVYLRMKSITPPKYKGW